MKVNRREFVSGAAGTAHLALWRATDESIADPRSDWLNCMISSAGELDDMARACP